MVKKWTLLFRTDVGVRIVKKPDTHTFVHRHGHERGHPHAHFESAVTMLPLYVYGDRICCCLVCQTMRENCAEENTSFSRNPKVSSREGYHELICPERWRQSKIEVHDPIK